MSNLYDVGQRVYYSKIGCYGEIKSIFLSWKLDVGKEPVYQVALFSDKILNGHRPLQYIEEKELSLFSKKDVKNAVEEILN